MIASRIITYYERHVFMFRLFGLFLVGLMLAGCQTLSTSPSGNHQADKKPQLTLDQKACIDLAEPTYEIGEHQKKAVTIKVLLDGYEIMKALS